jgi:hypothetical protein
MNKYDRKHIIIVFIAILISNVVASFYITNDQEGFSSSKKSANAKKTIAYLRTYKIYNFFPKMFRHLIENLLSFIIFI